MRQSFIWVDSYLPTLATQPERWASNLCPLLLGLAPNGVYLAVRSPERWCALTAPFHPYHTHMAVHISVALSLGSLPLGVIQHSALWSSDFPLPVNEQRLSFVLMTYRSILSHLALLINRNIQISVDHFAKQPLCIFIRHIKLI